MYSGTYYKIYCSTQLFNGQYVLRLELKIFEHI